MAELNEIKILTDRPLLLGSGANARTYPKGTHMVSPDKLEGWAIPGLIKNGHIKILSQPVEKVVDESELDEVIFGKNGGVVNTNVDKMLDSFFFEGKEDDEKRQESAAPTTIQEDQKEDKPVFNKLRRPAKRRG